MDPNEALRRIRELIANPQSTAVELVELEELVSDLDAWLSDGGYLPEAWGAHKYRKHGKDTST